MGKGDVTCNLYGSEILILPRKAKGVLLKHPHRALLLLLGPDLLIRLLWISHPVSAAAPLVNKNNEIL